ncbi:MAG: SPOR domain-containing protein [Fibrobacteraceae bacterium]|nr:SPOR domain-containing protein [Fibrobacteraceae bacterium]
MKYLAIFIFVFASLSFAASVTDVDSLFKGREYKPSLDSAARSDAGGYGNLVSSSVKDNKGTGVYALQFDAIADFDIAEKRRADLSSKTGLSIQLVFDAPFYKLRSGSYTKDKAEDKARSLAASDFTVLVVKVK